MLRKSSINLNPLQARMWNFGRMLGENFSFRGEGGSLIWQQSRDQLLLLPSQSTLSVWIEINIYLEWFGSLRPFELVPVVVAAFSEFPMVAAVSAFSLFFRVSSKIEIEIETQNLCYFAHHSLKTEFCSREEGKRHPLDVYSCFQL